MVARLAALFFLCTIASALAEPLDVRRRYEEALVNAALGKTGLVQDASPDGKVIERIDVVANDVIMKGDYGLPYRIPIVYPLLSRVTWLNHLHVRTKDYIIRNELLLHAGETFRWDTFNETGRNLRAMFIFAVARMVVCRGSAPDRVVILVVTKDNWTLRLNTDLEFDQARLDNLAFTISESNLAGRNKTVSIAYALDPGRHTIGLGWIDPRVDASRHQLQIFGNLYLSRDTGQLEGENVSLVTGRPLFSLRTQWGWELALSYTKDIVRTFQGAHIHLVRYTADGELIKDIYARRIVAANLVGTRSFGVLDKLNLSAGFRVTSALYWVPQQTPALSDSARAAYANAFLPLSENASGPFVSLQAFRASYVRLQNINTFALSEDYRTGPSGAFEVRFADPHLGFGSRFTSLTASYGATYYGRDNLLSFGFSGSARLEAGLVHNESWVNQIFDASFHEVTPKFSVFRLHIAGAVDFRRNDFSKTRDSLGSDSGLRGYEPRRFIGNNYYRANVELRTTALNLWTLHIGAVLFYDGGDAPQTLAAASWHQDAGVGLRVLFPQFDREVLRFDLGFPFETVSGAWAPRFSLQFGQAF